MNNVAVPHTNLNNTCPGAIHAHMQATTSSSYSGKYEGHATSTHYTGTIYCLHISQGDKAEEAASCGQAAPKRNCMQKLTWQMAHIQTDDQDPNMDKHKEHPIQHVFSKHVPRPIQCSHYCCYSLQRQPLTSFGPRERKTVCSNSAFLCIQF